HRGEWGRYVRVLARLLHVEVYGARDAIEVSLRRSAGLLNPLQHVPIVHVRKDHPRCVHRANALAKAARAKGGLEGPRDLYQPPRVPPPRPRLRIRRAVTVESGAAAPYFIYGGEL